MALSPQEAVPQQLRPLFEDVVSRTDAFCHEHLTDEYAQLCRQLAAALCRKSSTPLARGQVESWACAVVYTIGSVNFLFDKSQTPHMSAGDLCERFGVGKSTTSAKTRKIFDALDIGPYDPRWCLPSKLADNPPAWLIMFIMRSNPGATEPKLSLPGLALAHAAASFQLLMGSLPVANIRYSVEDTSDTAANSFAASTGLFLTNTGLNTNAGE